MTAQPSAFLMGKMLGLTGIVLVSAAMIWGTTSHGAWAQNDTNVEEIVVVGVPRTIKTVVGRSSTTGAPIENIELRRRVSYADLNLAMEADVKTFDKRIHETAQESCKKLNDMYPLGEPDEFQCIKLAVDSAKSQRDAAVATAQSR